MDILFDKRWFLKYQKILLWFCNTPLILIWFRWVLCINGDKSSVDKRKIVRILPNSILWIKNKRKKEVQEEFRTHDKFGKRLYYAFKPIWYLIHVWDTLLANRYIPSWNFGYDTLTQYPGSIGANNPVDGYVGRDSVNETFGTIRAGAGTNSGITDSSIQIPTLYASGTTDQFLQSYMAIFCFDTSSIGTGKTISSVVYSLYGAGANSNALGSTPIHICGATPASTTTLANSDYSQVQYTTFGNMAYASWNTAAYNDITLNANGISNIALTGTSKFSAMLEWIQANSAPTWIINKGTYYFIYMSDQTGTTNDPKIVVTYAGPPKGGKIFQTTNTKFFGG